MLMACFLCVQKQKAKGEIERGMSMFVCALYIKTHSCCVQVYLHTMYCIPSVGCPKDEGGG